jgi:phosphate/sulfate permease
MAVLGNRITLISPSRGFTMELGAAITVILASQYGIPVSTTMCITGATVGVSCCNGDWRGESNITFIRKKNASELIDTSFFRLLPGQQPTGGKSAGSTAAGWGLSSSS